MPFPGGPAAAMPPHGAGLAGTQPRSPAPADAQNPGSASAADVARDVELGVAVREWEIYVALLSRSCARVVVVCVVCLCVWCAYVCVCVCACARVCVACVRVCIGAAPRDTGEHVRP